MRGRDVGRKTSAEAGDEIGAFGGRRLRFFLRRWHLAVGDGVMHLDPLLRLGGVVTKRGQVEPALLRFRIMAFEAMLLQERAWFRGQRRDREEAEK